MSLSSRSRLWARRPALILAFLSSPLLALEQETFGPVIEVWGTPLPAFDYSESHWGEQVPLVELPQSLTVFEAKDIEASAWDRLEDAIGFVPGAQPGTLNGGLSTAVTVRGFAVTRMRWNGTPDIQRLFVRDLHTVERIEVLRGPEAVLEGITSPGGAVRYHGKQPRFTPSHRVGIEVGEHGQARTTLDSTGPLSERVAYRIVSAHQDGRTYPGGLSQRRDHTLAALTWRYHADGSLRLETEYQFNARPFMFGTVVAPGQGVMYDKVYGSPEQKSARRYERHGLAWHHAATENVEFAANLSRAKVKRDETLIGFWSIRNADSLWGYYTDYKDRYEQTNLRLESRFRFDTALGSHRVVLGRDDNRQHIDFSGKQSAFGYLVDINRPDFTAIDVTALPVARRYNHEHYRDHAWYAAARTSLGDALHLSLGVRDNRYRIRSDRSGAGLRPVAKSSHTTWHAGAVFQLIPALSTHVSVGTGIEPNRGVTRDGDFLPPQQARQVEGGMRWMPAESVAISGTVYRIGLENLPMVDPLDRNALITTGRRQAEGLELSATAHLSALQLHAGSSWQKTRNLSKTFNGQGDAFVNVPRHSASLRASYDFSLKQQLPLRLWFGGAHVGSRYGNAANSFKVKHYTRWDIGGDVSLSAQTQIRFSVRNLADKRYVSSISSASDVYQGPRRRIWVGLTHEI